MKYYWLLVWLLFPGTLLAQQQIKPADTTAVPKIGLVLSGGGAKGLAHIGALKVIEESGLKIEYIAGTSMGAVIGSLYAAGYSPEQLDSIFRTTDFKTLIQDDLPRRVKNYYEKQSSDKYALTLPFDHFRLSFPSGLSKGQNIYNLLAQLMSTVHDVQDFDQLPIPFLCVGTNIETGERLVFEKGSLAQSVAASAAIPSLFTPVEIDSSLYSDGGITDNYAIEELRKKGMDYIIGVDVQDSLAGRDDLGTVVEIMTQVSNFRTINAMREKREKTDLYIHPDIKAFSIISFDKGKEIIDAGEKATLTYKNTLDSLASVQGEHPVRVKRRVPQKIRIGDLNIMGDPRLKRNYIRGKLKFPTHEEIDFAELNEGLNNLSATNDFQRITYKLNRNEEGEYDIDLFLKEQKGRTNLRFSLHYDGLYKSAALVNFTHKQLLFDNDRISIDLIPGENSRYNFDYFIDKGSYWSVGLSSSMAQFGRNIRFAVLEDKFPANFSVSRIQTNYADVTNQIYLQTVFLNKNAMRFRAGFEHKFTKIKTGSLVELSEDETPTPVSLNEKINTYGPYGVLEYDSFDNSYFPTKGFFFRGEMHAFLFKTGASVDFEQFSTVKGKMGFATELFPRFYTRIRAESGFQFGSGSLSAFDFYLGGFGNDYVNNITPFFGYDFLDRSGNSYIKSSLELDYQPANKNHIMLGYNIANIGQDLYKDGKIFDVPDYSGFYAGYGMETILGPLQVYYSFSPEITQSKWFVSLGFWF